MVGVQICVKILKVLREAAVPGKVLMMNLTLDFSMIKATIGTVNSAKWGTLHYRLHLTKITTILSGFSTGYFHVKIFTLGRSVSLSFFCLANAKLATKHWRASHLSFSCYHADDFPLTFFMRYLMRRRFQK